MRVASYAFQPGSVIPKQFTCDGQNLSPPLAWSGAPPETRSFALICADPDAPGGTFYHWAIYDMPPSTTGLAEGWPPFKPAPPQAVNDFGRPGYSGPCPPPGHGPHRYLFTLYALRVNKLPVPAGARARDVAAASIARSLGTGELIGTYSR
ncbi:MAG: YbhB/YbcL family Raf kinase inhibitor-like protein [Acetobacteraceae bacterium]|nr:YbhB/YbcL family Raf kinase inhibitor-like protein [Acetobacteraceae bacterium]